MQLVTQSHLDIIFRLLKKQALAWHWQAWHGDTQLGPADTVRVIGVMFDSSIKFPVHCSTVSTKTTYLQMISCVILKSVRGMKIVCTRPVSATRVFAITNFMLRRGDRQGRSGHEKIAVHCPMFGSMAHCLQHRGSEIPAILPSIKQNLALDKRIETRPTSLGRAFHSDSNGLTQDQSTEIQHSGWRKHAAASISDLPTGFFCIRDPPK